MIECIGIKFDNGPKVHYVEAPQNVPKVGSHCVVNTKRGLEIGVVRTQLKEYSAPNGHFVRKAFEEDLKTYYQLKEKAEDLKWFLRARVRQASVSVKIIHLEFNLEETVLVVHYSAKEIQDLRPFIRDLLQYTQARIEFHNVGPRGQARVLGTIGICGQGSCSSTWLQSFSAVGVRMAREQQLPLNPEKISGPCGRLMCCLQYEHDMYKELLKDMPNKYTHACHDKSGHCGRVVKVNPFKQTVELQTEHNILEFPAKEVRTLPNDNDQQELESSYEDIDYEDIDYDNLEIIKASNNTN